MKPDYLEVVGKPGYTSGNVSIYFKDKNALFIGDSAIFRHGKPITDDVFAENIGKAKNSLEKIKEYSPVAVFPSQASLVLLAINIKICVKILPQNPRLFFLKALNIFPIQ
ncbi:MAG: MBL fold metallo-hydrolase [Ferroplasma sp.]